MTYEAYRDALLAVALEKGCDAAEVYAQEASEFSVFARICISFITECSFS